MIDIDNGWIMPVFFVATFLAALLGGLIAHLIDKWKHRK